MSSISNASFGSRIQNAKNLVSVVGLYPNFAPVRTEDSISAMTALIDSIDAANNGVINGINAYNKAVKARKEQFQSDAMSVTKLVSPIKNSIKAQYGAASTEAAQIDAILTRMRSSKPTIVMSNSGGDPISISNTEMSFGALTLNFSNLIQTLASFTDYAPIAPHLSVANLTLKRDGLVTINAAAATTLFELQTNRNTRSSLYEDLKIRISRIKSYVSAVYGNTSREHKGISKFVV